MGDTETEEQILRVMGEADGEQVIRLLEDQFFDENVSVELSASSASANRFADRQDAIMLAGMLGNYYQRAVELVQLAEQSGSEAIKTTATQIAEKSTEIIDRTLRTFENVRDPRRFLIEINEAIDQIQAPPAALNGIAELLGGGAPGAPAVGGNGVA